MNPSELERLLWERIDGTIEAADAERLRRLIASEPEAERLEAEITRLASELDGIEMAPAPAGLADDIRRALRAASGPQPKPRVEGVSWIAGLSRLLGPQPTRRLVYVAATLTLAVVGYQLVTRPTDRDDGPFVGTAGLMEQSSEAPAVRLELPGERGVLTIVERGRGLSVDLEISPGQEPARLVVLGTGFEIKATGWRGDPVFEPVPMEGGLALDVTDVGGVELALAASAEPRGVTISVVAGGETLITHELTLEPPRND